MSMESTLATMRSDIWQICRTALGAADASNAVRRFLSRDQNRVLLGDLVFEVVPTQKIWLFGAGKASARMAQAAEEILGDLIAGGLVITKYDHSVNTRVTTIREAGHPLPDQQGLAATQEMLHSMETKVAPGDLALFLLSGGASALMELPAGDITLGDLMETNRRLISCGATIQEINAVRKHLSLVKGGQLARRLASNRLATLILSDVPGDDLESIGSGPTVADSSTFARANAVLSKFSLGHEVPIRVKQYLQKGERGEMPETVKPGDPCLQSKPVIIVGSNALSCEAARNQAQQLGYHSLVYSTQISMDNLDYAKFLVEHAGRCCNPSGTELPHAFLSGGETTVLLTGHGKGGRNQDLALNMVSALANMPLPMVFASLGTDGSDGPTDAAGALADNRTLSRHYSLVSRPLEEYLHDNDSYSFFDPLGDLIKTGPTGTNVMDLHLLLIRPPTS